MLNTVCCQSNIVFPLGIKSCFVGEPLRPFKYYFPSNSCFPVWACFMPGLLLPQSTCSGFLVLMPPIWLCSTVGTQQRMTVSGRLLCYVLRTTRRNNNNEKNSLSRHASTRLPYHLFTLKIWLFLFMHVSLSGYMLMRVWGGQRGQIPGAGIYKPLWAAQCGWCELNLGPLQE